MSFSYINNSWERKIISQFDLNTLARAQQLEDVASGFLYGHAFAIHPDVPLRAAQ